MGVVTQIVRHQSKIERNHKKLFKGPRNNWLCQHHTKQYSN
jgi:hypothetical protein